MKKFTKLVALFLLVAINLLVLGLNVLFVIINFTKSGGPVDIQYLIYVALTFAVTTIGAISGLYSNKNINIMLNDPWSIIQIWFNTIIAVTCVVFFASYAFLSQKVFVACTEFVNNILGLYSSMSLLLTVVGFIALIIVLLLNVVLYINFIKEVSKS